MRINHQSGDNHYCFASVETMLQNDATVRNFSSFNLMAKKVWLRGGDLENKVVTLLHFLQILYIRVQ
jgi:hypothetical protein